jgi:hypothetical protein
VPAPTPLKRRSTSNTEGELKVDVCFQDVKFASCYKLLFNKETESEEKALPTFFRGPPKQTHEGLAQNF